MDKKKNRINSTPSNVLFAHSVPGLHGFRLQCSGDMLHGICKDCENKYRISCDLFQMQHDGSGGSHI